MEWNDLMAGQAIDFRDCSRKMKTDGREKSLENIARPNPVTLWLEVGTALEAVYYICGFRACKLEGPGQAMGPMVQTRSAAPLFWGSLQPKNPPRRVRHRVHCSPPLAKVRASNTEAPGCTSAPYVEPAMLHNA